MMSDNQEQERPILRCSFCNKTQRQVKKLIAGPAVQICEECVDICVDIIAEDRKDPPPAAIPEPPPGLMGYPRKGSASLVVANCSLCHMLVPLEHLLAVHSRGAICPGCVGAIEAAVAATRDRPVG